MRRAAFLIFVLVVFGAMTATVAVNMMSDGGQQRGSWQRQATPVAAYAVSDMAFADVIEALGTARADETVTITARVTNQISRINFESGDRVEAGHILVELANAEQAADLAEARATLREAEREYDRVQELIDRGIAARQRQDEVTSAVERAQARVNSIQAQLADRIITAPFSGVVGLREVSLGELVRPGDVIAQLDDTSIIKLDFSVPERFLAALRPGLPIQAMTAAYPDDVFVGVVSQIDSRIDPVTRTVTVRAEIGNSDSRLLPGQLMTVEIRRDVRDNPAIPGSALTRYLDDTFVFVLDESEEGARVRQVEVELGRRAEGLVEVVSGIEAGDLIVRDGVHRVRAGMTVRITERENAAPGAGQSMGTAAAVSQ